MTLAQRLEVASGSRNSITMCTASVIVATGILLALKAIDRRFQQAGITIAFPERDLHLDTHEPLRVRIESTPADAPPGVASGGISEPRHPGLRPST